MIFKVSFITFVYVYTYKQKLKILHPVCFYLYAQTCFFSVKTTQ